MSPNLKSLTSLFKVEEITKMFKISYFPIQSRRNSKNEFPYTLQNLYEVHNKIILILSIVYVFLIKIYPLFQYILFS